MIIARVDHRMQISLNQLIIYLIIYLFIRSYDVKCTTFRNLVYIKMLEACHLKCYTKIRL